MSKVIRVSDETYEWIKARASQDGKDMGQLFEFFTAEEYKQLDDYIAFALAMGEEISDDTLEAWVRYATNMTIVLRLKPLGMAVLGFQ